MLRDSARLRGFVLVFCNTVLLLDFSREERRFFLTYDDGFLDSAIKSGLNRLHRPIHRKYASLQLLRRRTVYTLIAEVFFFLRFYYFKTERNEKFVLFLSPPTT